MTIQRAYCVIVFPISASMPGYSLRRQMGAGVPPTTIGLSHVAVLM